MAEQDTPKILLTGPTGFIGKPRLYKLDQKGYRVRCMVRPPEELKLPYPLKSEPELVHGDLLDPESIEKALEGCEITNTAIAIIQVGTLRKLVL